MTERVTITGGMASCDAGGRKSPLCLRGDLSSTYGNFFLESTVMAEYAQLLQHPVPGVYVLPSEVSPLIWYGLLSVRGGIYEGAVFKFTILIPANYPDGGCPVPLFSIEKNSHSNTTLFAGMKTLQEFDFQAGVYHPLVDFETGELETKKEFQRWRRDINHVHHLLTFARKIFYNIDTSHAANREAAEFFRSDVEKFKLNVRESVDACLEDIMNYDPSDSHSVKMGKWTMDVMKAARTSIFEPEFLQEESLGKNAQTCGLSWVKQGSKTAFSKDDS